MRRETDGTSRRMPTVAGAAPARARRLVGRTGHAVVPPRVDHAPTPLGSALHVTIQALVTWTEVHRNEVAAARAAYDVRGDG
ncbi:hypothetical protein I4J48_30205 [Pseudonocardia sp. KRD-169]|uniref:HTH hxlR-type domain-containing protein n=1 Tax=Pseudonocardia abyssalis TaxID=2792008 RepID=A0ABS6V137_9PSEU|nr:hypothetical protein [Pseudonocardia abyssalis]MBW0138216.1 hypothetical protein [Pseudonocardia abyssalis]